MTNRAVFLDRDGVVNVDHGYVHKKENFEFVDGIFDLCKKAYKLGYLIIIVTNQSGIGRGYYTKKDFFKISEWMKDCFMDKGISISKIYFCPHHEDAKLIEYKKVCDFRKPNPGMIHKAIKEFEIDPKKSILVGDNSSDIEAGIKAGVNQNFLYKKKIKSRLKYIEITNLREIIEFL